MQRKGVSVIIFLHFSYFFLLVADLMTYFLIKNKYKYPKVSLTFYLIDHTCCKGDPYN